jgi:hypothetical protein
MEGTNDAFKLFDNQLFARVGACQQHALAMRAPTPPALQAGQLKVSGGAPAQQPSCSYGMSDDIMRDLQRALEHRHIMLKTYKNLTGGLWEQLQQVLDKSEKLPAAAEKNIFLFKQHCIARPCALSQALCC